LNCSPLTGGKIVIFSRPLRSSLHLPAGRQARTLESYVSQPQHGNTAALKSKKAAGRQRDKEELPRLELFRNELKKKEK